MTLGAVRRATVVAAAFMLVGSGAALAAATLPQRGKVYDTGGGTRARVRLTLIVSAADAKRLVAGPANPPIGSQFALATGAVGCPRAARNAGLRFAPFGLFSFPGARLKLRHGHYGFSVTRTDRAQTLVGSPVKPFKLTLRIAGALTSPTAFTGTVAITGGPCGAPHPVHFTAALNPRLQAAPGA